MRGMRASLVLTAILAVTGAAALNAADDGTPGMRLNVLRPKFETVAPGKANLQLAIGGPVSVALIYTPPINPASTALFNAAATKWMNRIPTYGATVNGPASITINVSEPAIDGVGGILGSAGPQTGTSTGGFTVVVTGIMQFDSADVAAMISNGTYGSVIEHEMGHVLGIGTLWNLNNVYINGTGNYTGASGLAAWQGGFSGQGAATSVPVELEGGAGTADGHWNENAGGAGNVGITEISSGTDMRLELMTGWLNAPAVYTNLTHRSMADLGYTPNAVLPAELTSFSID